MGHRFSTILIHAVFSTKRRLPLIDDSIRDRLYAYVAGVAKKEFGWARRIGGAADHVHALLEVRADVPVSRAMNRLKSLSGPPRCEYDPNHVLD